VTIQMQCKTPGATAQRITLDEHVWMADISMDEGGGDEGPSPHDLYDAALGACKALTVLWFARKKGIAVDDIQTEVTADRSQERAGNYKIFTRLVVSGNISEEDLAQLRAAAEKCPVHKLMTQVTTDVQTAVDRAP